MKKYSRQDAEDPVGQELVKVNFVFKSRVGYYKETKLTAGWNDKSIEELLMEIQNVFLRRVKEK